MQHKQPQRQTIDNFIPSGRAIGSPQSRRNQQFPDVGVTLSSYRGTLGKIEANAARPGAGLRAEKKDKPRRWRWSKKKITLLVLLPFVLVGLWLGLKFALNASKIFNGNLFSIFTTTQLKGEDSGRVNFLLAGNSADDPGHNGANLTDSIMILSLNTHDHTAFLLSVPRDLYVYVPGYGHAKINEAYVAGQDQDFSESGYANGGMGMLQKVIYQNLGIKTQYYALINYTALRDAVNAVGGITVTIQSSDPRGLYDPSIDYATHGPLVRLSNGPHVLNGEQALDLARARGDAYGSYGFANSDFTRTQDQRLMLLALKQKIFSTGVLANPLTVTKLFDSLGNNIKTDMKLSEARRLYDLMKKVPNSNIKSYALNDLNGKNYLSSYTTSGGQSTLIPAAGVDNFGDIKSALMRLTTDSAIIKENASIVVLNGTDVYGLASRTQTSLQGRQLNITNIGDAQHTTTTSYIINNSHGAKPATLKLLKQLYGKHVTTTNPYAQTYKASFIIVLGGDQVS
jgi:LCP family protein required for cell wall assembly